MQERLERLIPLRHILLLLTFLFSFNVCAVNQPFIEVITSDAYPVSGIKSVQRLGYEEQNLVWRTPEEVYHSQRKNLYS